MYELAGGACNAPSGALGVRWGSLTHPETLGMQQHPLGCVAAFIPIGQRTLFNAPPTDKTGAVYRPKNDRGVRSLNRVSFNPTIGNQRMQRILTQREPGRYRRRSRCGQCKGGTPYRPAACIGAMSAGHKKPRTRRGGLLICHVRQFGAVVLLMPKNLRRA